MKFDYTVTAVEYKGRRLLLAHNKTDAPSRAFDVSLDYPLRFYSWEPAEGGGVTVVLDQKRTAEYKPQVSELDQVKLALAELYEEALGNG